MATPNVGILTNAGKNLIDQVNAGQTKITFSKIAFSSMDNSQLTDDQVKALTAITPQEVVVNNPEVTLDNNTGETRIRATGTNEALTDGVYVKTYAVYAKDDSGNEILYGTTVSPNPNYLPEYDGVTPQVVTYSYKVNISNTSNITFTNSNDVYVSDTDLAEALQPYAKTIDVNQQLDKKVNVSDMRKPASDVAGIDEVSTLQTQVDNSAVGTNLYTDTKNFDNPASWRGFDSWTKTTDTYNGFGVMQTTQSWNGLSQYIQVKKGDVLTYSVYAKYISGTGTSEIYWTLTSQTEGNYSSATEDSGYNYNNVTITDSWQRVSRTTVATSDGYLRPRLEREIENTNTLQIAGIKLEKGSVATDWCPNPDDKVNVADMRKPASDVAGIEEVNAKADDSKVVHTADMRKPASDVAGIEEVNAKADDSKVVHTADMRKPASDVAGIEEVNAKADTSAVDQLKTNLTNQVSTLQTQVDNSAVGTNLLLGTSSSEQSYTDSFSTVAGWSSNSGSAILEATNAGSTYTYSMYLTKLTGSFIFGYWAYDSNKKYIGWYYSGVHSSSGKVSWTFTVPSGISYIDPHVVRNSDDFTCTAKGEKLELGSHATDWCPNPDDKVNVSDMRKPANDVAGIEEVNAKQDKLTITPADDSKVAHLSGANNFDTTPTVNNNPLLLASSLPSDLARTGSDQEFTGKNTFDTAPIDKTTGKPYITKDGVPSDVARTGQDANFTGRLQKGGIDVATAADLKSVENSAWRIADLSSSNGLLKPKSFFYRIDDTNKTMYFLLPLMSTTSSYAPYSRLIDLSSIIHNVQSVSGYFLWSSAEYYVTSFAVIGAGDGAYIKNNSLLHIEQYNYLITTTPTNSVDSLKSYNGICSLTYDSLMNDN